MCYITYKTAWWWCSVAQSCPTLCDSMDCSTPGFPVLHISWSLLKLMLVMPSSHLILWCPLVLLPSIFPSIRVFSSESTLCMRWPKCWSFSISASNECSGLTSLRIDRFDLLAVQGTLQNLYLTATSPDYFLKVKQGAKSKSYCCRKEHGRERARNIHLWISFFFFFCNHCFH